MSHQTGIRATQELRDFFGSCRQLNNIRMIVVKIEDEKLTLKDSYAVEGSWSEDYKRLLDDNDNITTENEPAYIFIRLDTMDNGNYEWMLISWTPESSTVRNKMLYASTKATLKNEFGAGQIKDEHFASSKSEVTFKSYDHAKRDKSDRSTIPLTAAEAELAFLHQNDVHTEIGIDSRFQTLKGVAFPIEFSAQKALKSFQDGKFNYVRLKIDINNEKILLDHEEDLEDLTMLQKAVPTQEARYHIFLFPHEYEGDYFKSVIFTYSMPGCAGIGIKERMLYSSCKNPLISVLEEGGFKFDKKLEIDEGKELSKANLLEELHPTVPLEKLKFSKPKPPARRTKK